tara:strand:- start:68 stop:220 length:153 start_codon:yes stop_codon:yes gene_type:complete
MDGKNQRELLIFYKMACYFAENLSYTKADLRCPQMFRRSQEAGIDVQGEV